MYKYKVSKNEREVREMKLKLIGVEIFNTYSINLRLQKTYKKMLKIEGKLGKI